MTAHRNLTLITCSWCACLALGCESAADPASDGDGGRDVAAERDGAAARDSGADGPTTVCGFVMPNPASAGLPNPAAYDTTVGGLTDLTFGADANVWFTEIRANKIGRLIP